MKQLNSVRILLLSTGYAQGKPAWPGLLRGGKGRNALVLTLKWV